MTANPGVKSMCRGAEMKAASLQTEIFRAIKVACLNADAIAETIGQSRYKVMRGLSGLVDRGLVERKEHGCFLATELGLAIFAAHGFVPFGAPVAKFQPPARRSGTMRQRAWNVMRIKSPFTLQEVQALAAQAEDQGAKSLPEWILALEKAGYIRREPRREAVGRNGGHGLIRYSLIRNTGMAAPVHSAKYDCVRDPNTGEDFPCKK